MVIIFNLPIIQEPIQCTVDGHLISNDKVIIKLPSKIAKFIFQFLYLRLTKLQDNTIKNRWLKILYVCKYIRNKDLECPSCNYHHTLLTNGFDTVVTLVKTRDSEHNKALDRLKEDHELSQRLGVFYLSELLQSEPLKAYSVITRLNQSYIIRDNTFTDIALKEINMSKSSVSPLDFWTQWRWQELTKQLKRHKIKINKQRNKKLLEAIEESFKSQPAYAPTLEKVIEVVPHETPEIEPYICNLNTNPDCDCKGCTNKKQLESQIASSTGVIQ
jgi:hypothetical protein